MDIKPQIVEFTRMVIASEIRTLRERGSIRPSDEEDLASEIMVEFITAWPSFNPDRAPVEAFVNQVVQTRLVSVLRKRRALKRRGRTVSLGASAELKVDSARDGGGQIEQSHMRMDIHDVLEKLTTEQRARCDELMRQAVTPAARELGMPRSTLRDAIDKIREVFRDEGLEDYL